MYRMEEGKSRVKAALPRGTHLKGGFGEKNGGVWSWGNSFRRFFHRGECGGKTRNKTREECQIKKSTIF